VSTKVVSLKCGPEEHEAWKAAAGPRSFNSWARSALNQAARLDVALAAEDETNAALVERSRVASARLEGKKSAGKCECPGPRPSWCKRCGVMRG
jgi:uncharacterized Zn finger protein